MIITEAIVCVDVTESISDSEAEAINTLVIAELEFVAERIQQTIHARFGKTVELTVSE